MVKPLLGVGTAMASFSESYKNESQLFQLTSSVLNFGKYMLDPDLRAQKVCIILYFTVICSTKLTSLLKS